jgi:hypothetical protein
VIIFNYECLFLIVFYMKVVYDNVVWIDMFNIIMLYMFCGVGKEVIHFFYELKKKKMKMWVCETIDFWFVYLMMH